MLNKEEIEEVKNKVKIINKIICVDSNGIREVEITMKKLLQYIQELEQENKTLKQCLIDNNAKDVNEHLYLGNPNM